MSIVKRDSFRKTLIALGAAAVMGGAAASANPAVAVCGPCRPSVARSPCRAQGDNGLPEEVAFDD